MTDTLYILAGGNDRSYEDYGPKLAHVVNEWVVQPKIVSCFFSKDPETWEESAKNWDSWFKDNFGATIEYRATSPQTFLSDVAWADVIYLHGGTTNLLESAMEAFDNLERAFAGKIVIGSSAGANYLSKTYFSPKRNIVGHGSGIVDVHTVVHYGAQSDGEIAIDTEGWRNAISGVRAAIKGDGHVTLIPEGTFTLIVK